MASESSVRAATRRASSPPRAFDPGPHEAELVAIIDGIARAPELSRRGLDRLLKRQDEMVEQRSRELLEVVLALGPTFIKIGQALSIRQDILPAAYAAGLADLQDNVPPFSAAQGRAVIEREAEALGIERREIEAEEIVDRLIFALANEGFRILEEGIAQRPGDIDIVYLYGYGFPAWRGGPMHYAESVGLDTVLARIESFRECFGEDNWTPAPLLEKLVREGKSLTEWAKD